MFKNILFLGLDKFMGIKVNPEPNAIVESPNVKILSGDVKPESKDKLTIKTC